MMNSKYNCSKHLGTLNLKDMGSFHVGGKNVSVNGKEPYLINVNNNCDRQISIDPNGIYILGQMYAQYYIPQNQKSSFPLLLWHGGGMTGKAYETTPDGRTGWLNYFIRCGWKSYLCDSVERGRSGWVPYVEEFNDQPTLFNKTYIFERFRLGETIEKGLFLKSQFPMEAYDMYAKEFVPRWTTTSELMIEAYCALLKKVGPSVIIGHSQGATLAFDIAEHYPELIKALVLIEPYGAGSSNSFSTLKNIPIFWIFGDYINLHHDWAKAKSVAEEYCRKFSQNGGDGKLLDLPAAGIYGNTHMMMMEKNNLQIADFIQDWLIDHKLCQL
mgnify:CR=1 FL=1